MEIKFTDKDKALFEELDIRTVYLFGSQVTGNRHPLSDFGLLLKEKPEAEERLRVYREMYKMLVDILPKEYLEKRFELKENEFDLVFLQCAPPYFQLKVFQEGRVLYEADTVERLRHEERILAQAADFQYFMKIQEKALMERI